MILQSTTNVTQISIYFIMAISFLLISALAIPLVKFIEVNPRFGGGAHLGFAAGAPTPLFLVKLLKGEILKPRIGKFKDNYFMLRYTEDMFFDLELLEYRVFK